MAQNGSRSVDLFYDFDFNRKYIESTSSPPFWQTSQIPISHTFNQKQPPGQSK